MVSSPESLCLEIFEGFPDPLGATLYDGGVNFAIFSKHSVSATLCLFNYSDLHKEKVTKEIPLDKLINKTGDVWHVLLRGNLNNMLYAYKFDGPRCPKEGHYYDPSHIVFDPYAKAVISRGKYGQPRSDGGRWPQMAGVIPSSSDEEFDWQDDQPLNLPKQDLIIYEMHVRGFTQHESSKTKYPGTYLGVTEKLDYLKELGINCIELMPCHEYNELEHYDYNSYTGDYKVNFWGYSTVSFFSPMIRYSSSEELSCGREAINEFKLLVREAHKKGIEVIMDVVFNHTAEGNRKGPIISFRGIDNRVYYMFEPMGDFYNYSDCGNTFNCNHPIVRKLILDNLRYWVTEMHVDGFRFDLAPILARMSSLGDHVDEYDYGGNGCGSCPTGGILTRAPLIKLISEDPILCKVKLIAEPWDGGSEEKAFGAFAHRWGIWSEWNGEYRDTVRQFIKGTRGSAELFSKCLFNNPHYDKFTEEGERKPWHSINFVCAHDGFTLKDLVSYNDKQNMSNLEENVDGEKHNHSWNCVSEFEGSSISVENLRKRQLRNFILCLMVSEGVPMIYMGDEYGHTKEGNNNSYCHDNNINYFRWDKKDESAYDFLRFCRLMIKFRRECESLGLDHYPTEEKYQRHGQLPGCPDYKSEGCRFVAFTLKDKLKGQLYIAFNANYTPVTVTLPDEPGYRWEPLVDTSKPAPYDFLSDDLPDKQTAIKQHQAFLDINNYHMLSYSSIILLLKPLPTC
ncbi:hypothetical protein vseg_000618 [Gypsophila vaccaria]